MVPVFQKAPGRPALHRRLAAALGVAALVGPVLLGSAPAALAQANPVAGYDTTLPIEISADSLEIEQDRQIATFRGDVDATQGMLKLRANKLTVHYRAGAKEGDANAISLIEADGDVFLSSPSETAQGERGVYDVDAAKIQIVGSVVLTRGNNVIRGSRLTLDLITGKSRMEGGGPTGGQTGGKQRVKALFVPSSGSE